MDREDLETIYEIILQRSMKIRFVLLKWTATDRPWTRTSSRRNGSVDLKHVESGQFLVGEFALNNFVGR